MNLRKNQCSNRWTIKTHRESKTMDFEGNIFAAYCLHNKNCTSRIFWSFTVPFSVVLEKQNCCKTWLAFSIICSYFPQSISLKPCAWYTQPVETLNKCGGPSKLPLIPSSRPNSKCTSNNNARLYLKTFLFIYVWLVIHSSGAELSLMLNSRRRPTIARVSTFWSLIWWELCGESWSVTRETFWLPWKFCTEYIA